MTVCASRRLGGDGIFIMISTITFDITHAMRGTDRRLREFIAEQPDHDIPHATSHPILCFVIMYTPARDA